MTRFIACTHSAEPREPIVEHRLSRRQQEVLELPASRRRKCRGPAGSGKTHLAIEVAKREALAGREVLILVHNITMRNRYRDLISRSAPTFERRLIAVATFHSMVGDALRTLKESERQDRATAESLLRSYSHQANQIGGDDTATESAIDFLRSAPQEPALQYDAVVIDEAQDFKANWMEAIEHFFKREAGAYYVFADEAQNVFSRPADKEGRSSTNVAGQWFHLPAVFRHCGVLGEFCRQYRQLILNTDEEDYQNTADFEATEVQIMQNCSDLESESVSIVRDLYTKFPDDTIAIVGSAVGLLVKVASIISNDPRIRMARTVETENERKWILENVIKDAREDVDEAFDKARFLSEIQSYLTGGERERRIQEGKQMSNEALVYKYELQRRKLQRSFKNAFPSPFARVWVATIHSMKGLQADHVIFLHDEQQTGEAYHELVYTAITRAKKTLTILDTKETEMLSEALARAS
ncbi:MAG: ATP-binding domain-containing protein [Ignavibacteria bacterium]|nr:ATP-binding domain-containing protein [Ignavibacteria bacterium]